MWIVINSSSLSSYTSLSQEKELQEQNNILAEQVKLSPLSFIVRHGASHLTLHRPTDNGEFHDNQKGEGKWEVTDWTSSMGAAKPWPKLILFYATGSTTSAAATNATTCSFNYRVCVLSLLALEKHYF